MPSLKNLSNVNVGTTANDGTGDLLRDSFVKINNSLNSLYTGGQVTSFSNDNQFAPGYTWENDKRTGIYNPQTGEIGFALNGQEGLYLNQNGTITWFGSALSTQGYVDGKITNFTGGISAANIVVTTGTGNTTVTVNGVPVVSALPTIGNTNGRIVFYLGDVWIYSSYPTGNGTGLSADAAIARAAGSDSRWVKFRGDTAITVGSVRPATAPEGTLYYETANALPYFFISGAWKTLSSVITSSAPSGLDVLSVLPGTGDPSNYSGRTVVVGSTAYIFISGAWQNLSNYVSGASGGSGSGISTGTTLPGSANAYTLFTKTGANADLYIYTGSQWNTISQYTANAGTARIKTLGALPSDVTYYNPGDLVIVSGKSYILRTDKSVWDLYSPGANTTVTNIVLNAGQVGNVELAANSVTNSKIVLGAVTGDRIADNTITGRQILDLSIGSAELSPNAVTTGKIQAGSITDREVAGNSINGTKIISGTITRSQLSSNIFNNLNVTANVLSDVSQNLGTVVSGSLRSIDGKMVIDINNKIIRIEL
jgi:hypothetical protein